MEWIGFWSKSKLIALKLCRSDLFAEILLIKSQRRTCFCIALGALFLHTNANGRTCDMAIRYYSFLFAAETDVPTNYTPVFRTMCEDLSYCLLVYLCIRDVRIQFKRHKLFCVKQTEKREKYIRYIIIAFRYIFNVSDLYICR
jgi:hypothetical protein